MDKRKGILIAVGGTGGHLFPAMALAKALRAERPNLPITFIGGGLKDNPYFQKNIFPYIEVPTAAPFGNGWKKALLSFPCITRGIFSSINAIRKEKPALVIGFGSFHAFPPLIASQILRIPMLLHESNAFPGKVNRLFSSRAKLTALYFGQAALHLKGKTAEVAMPLREECYRHIARSAALDYYALDSDKKTVLIFGGSQGALALNRLVTYAIELLSSVAKDRLQFLHFTGNEPEMERMAHAYRNSAIQACVKPFETQMANAWNLADLLISRSGAGTISEQFHYAVPALFVPYPYASDGHQEKNARFVADHVKGAEVILEKALTPKLLAAKLEEFLHSTAQIWAPRKEALASYYKNTPKIELTAIVGKLLDTGEI